MAYKNIVLVGTGSLGGPLLQRLVSANTFNVTVLARHTSTSKVTAPAGVRVLKVDFDSHPDLVKAFEGQEVLIITAGDYYTIDKITKVLVDAAVEAGIKRVIPSSFGLDVYGEPGKHQALWGPKHRVHNYLVEKARNGSFTVTALSVGIFLDWSLRNGFTGFDLKNKTAKLYDDGARPCMMTTVDSICVAVHSILLHPEETANKALRIHDFFISQRDVLTVLESFLGPFETSHISIAEEEKRLIPLIEAGNEDMGVFAARLLTHLLGPDNAASWELEDDSKLLRLPQRDLNEEVRKVVDEFRA